MSSETVQKGYHGAWQIHYLNVFPVHYRKGLSDTDVSSLQQRRLLVVLSSALEAACENKIK